MYSSSAKSKAFLMGPFKKDLSPGGSEILFKPLNNWSLKHFNCGLVWFGTFILDPDRTETESWIRIRNNNKNTCGPRYFCNRQSLSRYFNFNYLNCWFLTVSCVKVTRLALTSIPLVPTWVRVTSFLLLKIRIHSGFFMKQPNKLKIRSGFLVY